MIFIRAFYFITAIKLNEKTLKFQNTYLLGKDNQINFKKNLF